MSFALKEKDLGNAQAVARHAGSVPVFELPPIPSPDKPLDSWYADNTEDFQKILGGLSERRAAGVRDVLGMEERGRKTIWWPFTQHDSLGDGEVTLLDSAYGDYFCTAEVEKEGEGGEVCVRMFCVLACVCLLHAYCVNALPT